MSKLLFLRKKSARSALAALAELPVQSMLAVFGVLLLSWPIIQIAGERGVISLFQYLMLVWGGLIVLLALIGRAIGRHHTADAPLAPTDQTAGAKDVS